MKADMSVCKVSNQAAEHDASIVVRSAGRETIKMEQVG
jgi:hypothetical protein